MSDDDDQEAAQLQGGKISKAFSGVAHQLQVLTGAEKVIVIALKSTQAGDDAVISGTAGMGKEDIVKALTYCIGMFKSDTAVFLSSKADA